MRIATWNINSLKMRLPRIEEFLGYADVDVLCLQETKTADKSFPALAFSTLGYEAVHHSQGQWNGVAILSRVGIDDPSHGFGPDVADPYEGDARVLAATCGGIRFISVYVPNGREVGTDFYERKLHWLSTMDEWITNQYSPTDPLVVCGDFNVAPDDRDVWDPKAFVGSTHVTEPERKAITRLHEWGFEDTFRRVYPDQDRLYTYWDYRAGDFHQHRGMRIDHVLATRPVAERVTWAVVDRNARKGSGPSDHAPLIVDLQD
jgi:exodeoxyribonuclease III